MRFFTLILSLCLSTMTVAVERAAVEQALNAVSADTESQLHAEYSKALNLLDQEQLQRNKQQRYQQAIDNFAIDKQKLAKQEADISTPRTLQLPDDYAATELMLAQKDAKQIQLMSELNDVEQLIAEIGRRSERIPGLQEQVRSELAKLDSSSRPVRPEAKSQAEAKLYQREAQAQLLQAELQTLKLEQLSASNRQELARARAELLRKQTDLLEREIRKLQEHAQKLRRSSAESLIEATQSHQQEQIQQSPLLSALAADNRQYADQLRRLSENVDRVINKRNESSKRTDQLLTQYSLLEEQLSLSRIGSGLGEQLLNEYQYVLDTSIDTGIENQMSQVRLERFKHRKREQVLADTDQFLQSQLSQYKTLLSAAQRESFFQLVQQQRDLLTRLQDIQNLYLIELSKFQAQEQQKLNQANQLKQLINEHLLWIANVKPVSLSWPIQALLDGQAILDLASWQVVLDQLLRKPQLPLGMVLAAAIALTLFYRSRKPVARLRKQWASAVGRVREDRISLSLLALLSSLLPAVLLALTPFVWALLLEQVSSRTPHINGLIGALYSLSGNLFIAALVLNLAKPDSVLRGHLGWHKQPLEHCMQIFLRHLYLLMPLLTLHYFTVDFDAVGITSGIGRMLFIASCTVLLSMFWLIGKQLLNRNPASLTERIALLLYRLLLLSPVIALIATLTGYYYSGIFLMRHLVMTLNVAVVFWLLYALAERWMLVEQRRLAYQRAKERQEEQQAQREKAQQADQNDLSFEFETSQVDTATLKNQSLRLLRMGLAVGFLITGYAVWSDALSAMTWLHEVVLWKTTSADGVADGVTLADLLATLLIFALAIITSRNLPSLLELAILQRVKLDNGVSFAITTLSSYLVLLIGLLWGFANLGFEWSKLQWLVAALGVGLGFGLQEIFANMVSGLIILFERPIRPGDAVTIDDQTGIVSRINIRATTIVDWDRRELVIPNKTFITQQFINWSLTDGITRVVVPVGVAYGSDTDLVERLLVEATQECSGILETPEPQVFFIGFGNSTLDFELRFFTAELGQRLSARHQLLNIIYHKFNEQGVTIAFPQMDVHLHQPPQPDAS